MSNANYFSAGADNGGTDPRGLMLKVSTGEIMAAFAKDAEFLDKHRVRTINSGKSAQFIVTGRKAGARYHVPGTEVNGTDFKQSERTIVVDNFLITDHFFADIDEALAHYDIQSEVNMKMGEELRQAFNANVAACAIRAARASATVTGGDGGTELTNAQFMADADVLASGMFDAAAALDEKNVPDGDRFAFVRPAQYYSLISNKAAINKDYDGRGSYADGKIAGIAGLDIIKSKNLPRTNITSGPAAYQGDFTSTAALVMNREAVGTVKVRDLAVTLTPQDTRLGELMIAKYLMGHDYLRPECAVEFKTA